MLDGGVSDCCDAGILPTKEFPAWSRKQHLFRGLLRQLKFGPFCQIAHVVYDSRLTGFALWRALERVGFAVSVIATSRIRGSDHNLLHGLIMIDNSASNILGVSNAIMKAKCLMLDVDGVLIDGRPKDGLRWDSGLANDLGLTSEALVQNFFQAEWREIVVGRKALLPTLESVLKRIAPNISAEELVAYWFEMDSRVVQTVLSDIRTAKGNGLLIYLATNQEHLRANYLMQTLKLNEEVDGIIYSALAGYQKPHPEFFSYAEMKTGHQPEELLLIDDTSANIDAARASGWMAEHWDGSETLSEILPRYVGLDN